MNDIENRTPWFPSRDQVRAKRRAREGGSLSSARPLSSGQDSTIPHISEKRGQSGENYSASGYVPSAASAAYIRKERGRRLMDATMDVLGSKVGSFIVVGVLALGLVKGCGEMTDSNYGSDKAEEFLHELGYEEVLLEGVDTFLFFGDDCRKYDYVKYEFEVMTAQGESIEVGVCKGINNSPSLVLGD